LSDHISYLSTTSEQPAYNMCNNEIYFCVLTNGA
jgi:hypothetical protein